MAFGIDYSFGSGLSVNQMKAAGTSFVCRYLSWQPNPKNINKIEFDNLVKAGIHVVLVWEATGRDLVGGFRGGQHDAQEANRQAHVLGAPIIPIYFAPADYDVPEGDQAMINNYLAGAGSVIGMGRTGYYGGYWPLSRAADRHLASWWWQTYAWSGTNVDKRAHLYQYQNAARLGPAEVDYDHSLKADFGGWPRPAPGKAQPEPHPHPVPPEPPAPQPPKPGPPYRHLLADRTLEQMAADRHTTVEHLWVTTVRAVTQTDLAVIGKQKLGAAFPVYTSSP